MFHGRNREMWETRGLASASQRFDYYYAREELEAWVPRIRLMERSASELHLVMNTNNADQGTADARLMDGILEEGSQTECVVP